MKSKTKAVLGVAALVFCVAVGVAFLAPGAVGLTAPRVLAFCSLALFGLTVTYDYPVSGIVAPTAAQSRRRNMVTATVILADGDPAAVITHNWGLTAAELASLFPLVIWNSVTPGAAPTILSVSRATNTVTLTKAAGVGTGATIEVAIIRPHTIIR